MHTYIHTCILTHTYMYWSVCTGIYVERERCKDIYTCVRTHTYRERQRERYVYTYIHTMPTTPWRIHGGQNPDLADGVATSTTFPEFTVHMPEFLGIRYGVVNGLHGLFNLVLKLKPKKQCSSHAQKSIKARGTGVSHGLWQEGFSFRVGGTVVA